jgi:hypothetical protein
VIDKAACFRASRSNTQMNKHPMSDDTLTAYLAERVMRWNATPDRFIKSGRSWIPRWRFSRSWNLPTLFNCSTRPRIDTALREIVMASLAPAFKLAAAGERRTVRLKHGPSQLQSPGRLEWRFRTVNRALVEPQPIVIDPHYSPQFYAELWA